MPINTCPILELDMTKLGNGLFVAALTAHQLGHRTIQCTVRDYWHNQSPRSEFIRDAFTADMDYITDRWLGGTNNAVQMTIAILNRAHKHLNDKD
jgi:hypothetical protein